MRDRKETVVITGASAGLGRAIACEFAKHGARIGLLARGRKGLQGADENVRSAGGTPLMLETDVSDADATRCGGFTGFLQANVLCTAYNLPLSAHTAPAIHMHACCATTKAVHVEYFHDHARIENMVFDGMQLPKNGELTPDLSRCGLGLDIRRAEVSRYSVR